MASIPKGPRPSILKARWRRRWEFMERILWFSYLELRVLMMCLGKHSCTGDHSDKKDADSVNTRKFHFRTIHRRHWEDSVEQNLWHSWAILYLWCGNLTWMLATPLPIKLSACGLKKKKLRRMASPLGLCTHERDTDEAPGSPLQFCPPLATVAVIWRVIQ